MSENNDWSGIRISTSELVRLSALAERYRRESPGGIKSQLAGTYLSRMKGRGMEYAETRPYEPGDDVRRIDWRVTARTDRSHTKLFREERERPVMIFLDLDRSMYFGTRRRLKAVQAIRAAALFGWEALARRDRVGSMCVSEEEHMEFKTGGTRKLFLRQLHEIIAIHHRQLGFLLKTDWKYSAGRCCAEGLARLAQVVSPGSRVRIFSDGSGLDEKSFPHLRRTTLHNEVSLTLILDPLEQRIPRKGRYRISDGNISAWLEAVSEVQQNRYADRIRNHLHDLETRMHQLGVGVEYLSSVKEYPTGGPWLSSAHACVPGISWGPYG